MSEKKEMVDTSIQKGHTEENRMGTAPITRLMMAMSGPAMLSMLIQALYNVVDSAFVAHISENALTALTLANPLQLLFVGVGVGTGVGFNSVISRRLGARRFEEANQAASATIKLAIISWLFFAVVGLFFSGIYIHLFTNNAEICQQGKIYLTIVLVGCFPGMTYMFLEKTIQAVGNMLVPMVASISGCVTNIVLDAVLIFGLFGAPKMGVAGAAVATVLGQTISFTIILIAIKKKVREIKISWRMPLDKESVRAIYAVGAPSIIMQTVMSFASFLLNMILAGISTTAVAVYGVYVKLQSFVFMPVFGINQGTTPIFGYNFGAGNRQRLTAALKRAYIAAFTIMLAGLLVFQLLPSTLLSLFDASDVMLEIGIPAFRTISICFLPAAIGVVSGGLFSATGHGVISMITTLIRQLLIVVPCAYIFARIGGATMLWWAYPCSEVFGLCYTLLMVRRLFKKEINKLVPREGARG